MYAQVFSIGTVIIILVDIMDDLILITYIIAVFQIIAGFILIITNKFFEPAKESPIPMIGAIIMGLADIILIIFLLMYS